jgi:hypothetical protein
MWDQDNNHTEKILSYFKFNRDQEKFGKEIFDNFEDLLVILHEMKENGEIKSNREDGKIQILVRNVRSKHIIIENISYNSIKQDPFPNKINVTFENCDIEYIALKKREIFFNKCNILDCNIMLGGNWFERCHINKGTFYIKSDAKFYGISLHELGNKISNVVITIYKEQDRNKDFYVDNMKYCTFISITPSGHNVEHCTFRDCLIYPENMDKVKDCIFDNCTISDLDDFYFKFGKNNTIR